MYTFARVSIMNTQTGGFKQQIYFLTVGGYKSEIKVSADWAPLRTIFSLCLPMFFPLSKFPLLIWTLVILDQGPP